MQPSGANCSFVRESCIASIVRALSGVNHKGHCDAEKQDRYEGGIAEEVFGGYKHQEVWRRQVQSPLWAAGSL